MAKALLVGTIIVLVIVIVILLIAALWMRADFIECENTESPFCPQFTCPSSDECSNLDGGVTSANCGNGVPAVRASNTNIKST